MVATPSLTAYRSELMDALERFRQRRHSAHSGLVGEHIALAGELEAGPLCLALADALGATVEARRDAGLATAFLELASTSLGGLEGESDANPLVVANGMPLALNSADALYSLAHLAVLDLASGLEGLEAVVLAAFDGYALELWTEQSAGASTAVLGRMAGVLAALAAGRANLVEGIGGLGAEIIAGASPDEVRGLIDALSVGTHEKQRLTAILA